MIIKYTHNRGGGGGVGIVKGQFSGGDLAQVAPVSIQWQSWRKGTGTCTIAIEFSLSLLPSLSPCVGPFANWRRSIHLPHSLPFPYQVGGSGGGGVLLSLQKNFKISFRCGAKE